MKREQEQDSKGAFQIFYEEVVKGLRKTTSIAFFLAIVKNKLYINNAN